MVSSCSAATFRSPSIGSGTYWWADELRCMKSWWNQAWEEACMRVDITELWGSPVLISWCNLHNAIELHTSRGSLLLILVYISMQTCTNWFALPPKSHAQLWYCAANINNVKVHQGWNQCCLTSVVWWSYDNYKWHDHTSAKTHLARKWSSCLLVCEGVTVRAEPFRGSDVCLQLHHQVLNVILDWSVVKQWSAVAKCQSK